MERFDITLSTTPGELNTRRVDMANEPYEISFGQVLKAACDGGHEARKRIHPEAFSVHDGVGQFQLPVHGEEYAIPATAIQDTPFYGRIEWLASSGVPLLDRILTLAVPTRRGTVPIGGALPEARMLPEDPMSATAAASDPGITGMIFELAQTIEVQTKLSLQVIVQSSEDILGAVQDALRRSIAERLLQQILGGTGMNNQLLGLPSRTNVDGGTYVTANRGNANGFVEGETAIEDAQGTPGAWALGKAISDASRKVVIEPGGTRRVEEAGRLTLSGLKTYRDDSLTDTTGIVHPLRTGEGLSRS